VIPSARREASPPRRHQERRLKLLVSPRVEELRRLPIFSGVPAKNLDRLLSKISKHLHWATYERGEVVLNEGDYSDSAYFIVQGAVEVHLDGLREAGRRARVRPEAVRRSGPASARDSGMLGRGSATGPRVLLEAGEIFGEISALSRYPASATVRAVEEIQVLQIRLPGLRMLMAASPSFREYLDTRYRQRTLTRHLRQVPLFSEVDPSFLEDLKERAELLSFEPDQLIVEEGAPAEAFYLVRGGYLKVSVSSSGAELAVTYLRKGDYAGEVSLLLEERWPFSLRALEYVELVRLGREDFQRMVASYPAVAELLWKEMTERLKVRGLVTRNPISSEYLQMAMDSGLIHGESVLLMDLSTCTRCDDCVRACADTHGGEPRFIREGQKYRHWLIPTACYQCTDPVCLIDCPTGAIRREAGSLEVTIDAATCIGCANCAERCPWGNIVMVEQDSREDSAPVELATKCDLCHGRPEGPACVQMCPQGSTLRISFKDMERVQTTMTPEPAMLRPKVVANLKTTAFVIALLLTLRVLASSAWSWTPRGGAGLALGFIGAGVFFFEMLYAARRRSVGRLRTARQWLQAHVYLGAVAFSAVLLHIGLHLPNGAMGWWLLGLSFWTLVTGLLGVSLQKWIPAALADGLHAEAPLERIPYLVEKLVVEADARFAGSGDVLTRFYRNEVRPALVEARPSWRYLWNVRAGRQRALEPFRRLARFVAPQEKEKLEELQVLYTEKLELDAQLTLQRILRRWPLLHVPAAGLLAGFLLVHILAWIIY